MSLAGATSGVAGVGDAVEVDFRNCDRMRVAKDGASPSPEELDLRTEAFGDSGAPGLRKKPVRWFSSIGLGAHSIDEVSGVVSRDEGSDDI